MSKNWYADFEDRVEEFEDSIGRQMEAKKENHEGEGNGAVKQDLPFAYGSQKPTILPRVLTSGCVKEDKQMSIFEIESKAVQNNRDEKEKI